MPRTVTDYATPIPPDPLPRNTAARLQRVRRLAWVLDRSIPIGKWRIGLDPLLGLIPGLGDWAGAVLSLYVLYQGARLGLPTPVLTRMSGNIIIEALVGAVPVLGDLFDMAWQANTRNVRLVEEHYRPQLRPRSLNQIWIGLLIFAIVLLTIIGVLAFLVVKFVLTLVDASL